MNINTLCVLTLVKLWRSYTSLLFFFRREKELEKSFVQTTRTDLSQQSDTDLQWQRGELILLAQVFSWLDCATSFLSASHMFLSYDAGKSGDGANTYFCTGGPAFEPYLISSSLPKS